ncbi:MAG TPA: carboxypeptidase regulatory-like domain-containing protein [Terriglobales bacterium]|nr:carboxypeptidase regulatory-like domain-containing protein [Terriglobales bacterium]
MTHRFKVSVFFLLLLVSFTALAQTGRGWLKGVVTDPSGAVVVGATVTITSPSGQTSTVESNHQGVYDIRNLDPGKYNLTVTAKGFSPYQLTDVIVPAEGQTLDAQLDVQAEKQQVTVEDQGTDIEVSASHNASQTVIKGKDLEALSDDPDELSDELTALAGPSAGPNGGQIYIDGFTNGQLPPKSSIREIRVNQNPFSAQYDSLGYGRVEVFTKPGSDKFHGQVMFMDNNSALNTKSPFVTDQPDYNTRMFNANVSGPINKRASFFFDLQQRNIDNVSVINALYDPSTGQPLSTTVGNPHSRTSVNPRIDYQLSTNNTLTARYEFERDNEDNNGISTYTLPSLAYNSRSTEHTFQLSDTQVLSPRVINETRFQYLRENNNDLALDNSQTVSVNGWFTAGGNGIGTSGDLNNRYELQNYTSMALGKHFIKYGGRMRVSHETSTSTGGFNGTWTFNSLQDYQNAMPSQYTRTFGTPVADVSYVDLGVYAEDDWRLRPNFTLSYGLRLESQNQIGDHADWAPRIGFAWGLGSARGGTPKMVLRAGFGIFYDRFGQSLVLNTIRQNGVNQVQYITTCDPTSANYASQCPIAAYYPNVPDPSALTPASSVTIRTMAPNLRSPYTMQTAVTLERQIAKFGTASVTYLNSRGEHTFVSQNINAPLPDGTRPLGGTDNIYQYESAGIFRQNQLIANVRMNTPRFSLFSFYMLNYANSNTSGAGSFPSDPYNLMADYGRASFSTRNRFVLGGSFNAPYNFTFSPFIIANSGRPYNITLGTDANGDSIFNDRPAFANGVTPAGDLTKADFNLNPQPEDKLIPVNYATGPASFTVNMRFAKVFGFGKEGGRGAGQQGGGEDHHHGPGGFGRMGGGGHGPWGGGGGTNRRYNLTLSLHAMNLFNRVNYGTPVGNLNSPDFGISKNLAGGPFGSDVAVRRFFMQVQFAF